MSSTAACAGHPPDWWFPDGTGKTLDAERARTICARCEQRRSCYLDALARNEPAGIWGGILFYPNKVRRIRKQETAA